MNKPVPTYNLYGEELSQKPEFWVHAESIASRSRLHDWEIKPHRHEYLFQILHIRHGDGQALLGGQWQPFTAPAVIVVPEQHDHGFRFSRTIDGAIMTLMSKRFPARLPAHAGLGEWLSQPRLLTLAADHGDAVFLGDILDRAEREILQDAPGSAALLEAMFATALLMAHRLAGAVPAQQHDRDQQRFERLTALIGDGFRAHLPVETYARRLGMSVTHLNRITHSLTGKPVSRLIAERIVSEAKRDLVFTSISIQQIATGLGFDDHAYFSRFFSRHTGQSPSTYRQREQALLDG
ncbi:helix-turn-helix domain-containing protein [Rhizobium sp. CG5]|uniref:helix-turn-helix domain-containing protein n=1 Tax=Rhizobium sp. CG5 TaxID=2726076 RepID=UPI002033EB15|nr:helix-turn-helix domain-containing protein [Rhizobium sp. CG5]MCM2473187.1 helix-turn-helix domain-containing protein [Rhizobium sp. CG5]